MFYSFVPVKCWKQFGNNRRKYSRLLFAYSCMLATVLYWTKNKHGVHTAFTPFSYDYLLSEISTQIFPLNFKFVDFC